ncbi:MAG: LarC family nickel insertion protein [Bacteroidales bacterium]|nr:LarC family nickel insertion protein [Bacteroidales bacterium]
MNFTISATGYGIGQKNNPSRPNILRVWLAETGQGKEKGHEAFLVESNVDDMNPELSDYITARLFAAGAGDVWFTPVIMKKGRPAFTVSVICEEDQKDAVREILFTESTTIGLRVTPFIKETLHREFEEIETRFGMVVIKKSFFNNRLVSVKPEADRCAAIAAETGLPMKQVIQEITALALK